LLAPGSILPGIKLVVLGSFQKKDNSDGFRYACVCVCVFVRVCVCVCACVFVFVNVLAHDNKWWCGGRFRSMTAATVHVDCVCAPVFYVCVSACTCDVYVCGCVHALCVCACTCEVYVCVYSCVYVEWVCAPALCVSACTCEVYVCGCGCVHAFMCVWVCALVPYLLSIHRSTQHSGCMS